MTIIRDKKLKKNVQVVDALCPKRSCYHPHDCPVQGAGGVRESTERWMCLTNVNHGCPDPKPEPMSHIAGAGKMVKG